MASEIGVTKQLIRQMLLNDADVRGSVSGKIYPTHLQSSETATVLTNTPIIIIETIGGFARYFSQLQDVVFDLWVYSKNSSDECSTVYDLCFPVLQQTRMRVDNIDMVGLCRELDRPEGGWNEQVHAWYLKGRWSMKATS